MNPNAHLDDTDLAWWIDAEPLALEDGPAAAAWIAEFAGDDVPGLEVPDLSAMAGHLRGCAACRERVHQAALPGSPHVSALNSTALAAPQTDASTWNDNRTTAINAALAAFADADPARPGPSRTAEPVRPARRRTRAELMRGWFGLGGSGGSVGAGGSTSAVGVSRRHLLAATAALAALAVLFLLVRQPTTSTLASSDTAPSTTEALDRAMDGAGPAATEAAAFAVETEAAAPAAPESETIETEPAAESLAAEIAAAAPAATESAGAAAAASPVAEEAATGPAEPAGAQLNGSTTDTALASADDESAPQAASPTPSVAAGPAAPARARSPLTVESLGDLGSFSAVSDAAIAARERLRSTTLRKSTSQTSGETSINVVVEASEATRCADETEGAVAYATATVRGRSAVIILGPSASARVLDPATCATL